MSPWEKTNDISEGLISTLLRFSVVRLDHRILGDLGVMAVQSLSPIKANSNPK